MGEGHARLVSLSFKLFLLTLLSHVAQTFGGYNLWLAAENGIFLRHTSGSWINNMKQPLEMDWASSVEVTFPKD